MIALLIFSLNLFLRHHHTDSNARLASTMRQYAALVVGYQLPGDAITWKIEVTYGSHAPKFYENSRRRTYIYFRRAIKNFKDNAYREWEATWVS